MSINPARKSPSSNANSRVANCRRSISVRAKRLSTLKTAILAHGAMNFNQPELLDVPSDVRSSWVSVLPAGASDG